MTTEVTCFQFDNIEVRPASFQVLQNGKMVPLEPKAHRVLHYLIQNRERAVGKDEIIEAVWEGAAVTDNALTRVIAQIRRELGDDAHQSRYIQTLPTLGYRFVADLNVLQPRAESPGRTRKPLFAILAVAVIVALCASAWWLSRRRQLPAVEARTVQLTTSPGLDVGGSFSPNGKSIVYSSNRSGWFELYVRPLNPLGREVQLTSDGKQNTEPAWSPDGNWIAYHSVASHGIWLIPAAGGQARQITTFGSRPAWSPDSRQIAFRSLEPFSFAIFDQAGIGDSTLWTVAADGSQLRQVTSLRTPPGQHASPAWSPDGRRLIFASYGYAGGALWTFELSSGELKQFAQHVALPKGNPVYAPGGRGVYFAGHKIGSGFVIYYLRSDDNGQPTAIFQTRDNAPLTLSVSGDGRRLAYTKSSNISQLWRIGADAAGPVPVYQDSVVRARLPVYSPDGSRLAYIARRAGSSPDLWMMNADGSGAAAVAAEPGEENSPRWNTEGTAVLYSYTGRGRFQLRKVEPASGAQSVLMDGSQALARSSVTPDEKEVLYSEGRPPNIWVRPLKGGAPRQLTFDSEGADFPNPSPDGKWIAYELLRGNTTQIGLLDFAGRRTQQLTEGPGHNWPGSWASDNRRIAFATFRNGVWNLYWIDRLTREVKPVTRYTSFGSFVRNPAWRPGTDEIVYEYSLVKGNIHLLDLVGSAW